MDNLCKLILELYRAAKETSVEEFHDLALSLVKTQIRFRSAMWGTYEMTGEGMAVNSVHLHNEPLEILRDWVSTHRRDSVLEDLSDNPGRARIFHAPASPADVPEMFDFIRRHGQINALAIADTKRDPIRERRQGEWVSLYRAEEHDRFVQADQHNMERLMPHLVEALAINRMLGQKLLAGENPEITGTRALARMDGTLYHCGKKFAGLLRELWPEMKNGKLPAEFMTKLSRGEEVVLKDLGLAISTTPLGNTLLLDIQKISPLSRLSGRELEVSRLFGQGKSHKEIALQLEVSPSTVRNLLSNAYKKLGIRDKAALAGLFSDNNS